MRDFYDSSAPMPFDGRFDDRFGAPRDQADGLRRLFAGARPQRVLPLAANPHVAFSGVVVDQLTAALVAAGRRVLVVDAADRSPAPREAARIDLADAIEPLSARVGYLAARGLPLAHVDTRGSAGGFVDAVRAAAPAYDAVLLHAEASDLARMFQRRAARPLVLADDRIDSTQHAYAAVKLVAQRCGLMTFDLVLAAPPRARRLPAIAKSLAGCADRFLGAVLHDWAVVDPASTPNAAPPAALQRIVAAQLALADEVPLPALPPRGPVGAAQAGTVPASLANARPPAAAWQPAAA